MPPEDQTVEMDPEVIGNIIHHGNQLATAQIEPSDYGYGVDEDMRQALLDYEAKTREDLRRGAENSDLGAEAIRNAMGIDGEIANQADGVETPQGDLTGGQASPAGMTTPSMPSGQAPMLNDPFYNIPLDLFLELVQGANDYDSGNYDPSDPSSRHGMEAVGPEPIDAGLVEMKMTGLGVLSNEDVHAVIEDALDLNGIPNDPELREKWSQLLVFMARGESSFNPDAVNTDDPNAHGAPAEDGNPFNCSRGIWQTIPTTFAANHVGGTSYNIYDPLASGAAAVNYIANEYGVDRDTGEGLAEFASNRGLGRGFYKGY